MRHAGWIAALLALVTGTAYAETLQERVARDGIVMVEADDPGMTAAIRKAQQTLRAFLALAGKPRASATDFAVKVVILDGDEAEYFWITPFKAGDGNFSGQINNRPQLVKTVKFGQTITFVEGEIIDWLYMDNGRMQGNFTLCVLLGREPADQAASLMKQFGLRCDP
jgi:uncharacterized protein YegJ (DUF2314 family)